MASQHHWIIEPVKSQSSEGVCRKCGEQKTFENYVESSSAFRQLPLPGSQPTRKEPG